MTTCVQSNLHDQLRHIKGNQYELQKLNMYKDSFSENVTELILYEKNDGLFVAVLADK